MLVTNEDDAVVPGQSAQAKVSPVVSNATPEAAVEDEGASGPLPSLLTQQEGDITSRVWLWLSLLGRCGVRVNLGTSDPQESQNTCELQCCLLLILVPFQ